VTLPNKYVAIFIIIKNLGYLRKLSYNTHHHIDLHLDPRYGQVNQKLAGYGSYSFYEEKQGVLPLGCMAHVRRKFENALVTTSDAVKAYAYIALLYMLEANLRHEGANHEQIIKSGNIKLIRDCNKLKVG